MEGKRAGRAPSVDWLCRALDFLLRPLRSGKQRRCQWCSLAAPALCSAVCGHKLFALLCSLPKGFEQLTPLGLANGQSSSLVACMQNLARGYARLLNLTVVISTSAENFFFFFFCNSEWGECREGWTARQLRVLILPSNGGKSASLWLSFSDLPFFPFCPLVAK